MATSGFKHRKDRVKLRKPAVEKMRRERINSSIEQLRRLLQDELKARQPGSRLEKADILETAVTYLKNRTPGQSYADGFARCLEETARFLSTVNRDPPTTSGHSGRAAAAKTGLCPSTLSHSCVHTGVNTQIWRPW